MTPLKSIEEIADCIQGNLDAVLLVSRDKLVVFPGEDWPKQKTPFNDALEKTNTFNLHKSSRQFLKFAYSVFEIEYGAPRSQYSEATIASFAEGVLKPNAKFYVHGSILETLTPQDVLTYFSAYANAEEINNFKSRQEQVLNKIIEELKLLETNDIEAVDRIVDNYSFLSKDQVAKFVRSNANIFNDSNHLDFIRNAMPEIKPQKCPDLGYNIDFIERFIKELKEISSDKGSVFEQFLDLSRSYKSYGIDTGCGDHNLLARCLYLYPERINNSDLDPIRKVVDYGLDALDQPWVKSSEDMGKYISSQLSKNYIEDINPGTATRYFSKMVNLEDKLNKPGILKLKRERGNKLIPVREIDPNNIIVADGAGVSAIFASETRRPAPNVRRSEKGGKSGHGQQKPDLWKP